MDSKTDNKTASGTVVKFVVVALVAAGLGFYGGMTYAKNGRSGAAGARGNGTFAAGNFGGGTGAAGAQGRGGFRTGGAGGVGGTGGAANGGFINGEVLSVDSTGITVKLRDGGSKIVFTGDSTVVSKPTDIKLGDVAVGDDVMVVGKANDDGSVTAQSIQVRPAGTSGPGGMGGPGGAMMIRGGEQGGTTDGSVQNK